MKLSGSKNLHLRPSSLLRPHQSLLRPRTAVTRSIPSKTEPEPPKSDNAEESKGPAKSAPEPANTSFLDSWVDLPGGYKTTRRDVFKFISLGGALTSSWVFLSRASAMSMVSPRAILEALFPTPPPAIAAVSGDAPDPQASRVAAFKRFVSDLEARGGGPEVGSDFPAGADWLNVPGPLSLKRELKGKVVVLDFWTLCCINCLHVLPDLRNLERKFEGRPVSVVGVHSAKFESEKDTGSVRAAVIREGVEHPVVNDKSLALWKSLGVSSWPTLVVVSPRGRILARVSGEGHGADLEDLVQGALEYYSDKDLLDESPVPVALERNKDARVASSQLRFPGKVAVDQANGQIFVSDTANHRILVLNSEGKFQQQIGGNGAGLRDGSLEAACFFRPQGLAYNAVSDTIYVADTENHAVRAVSLAKGEVKTVVGTGQKGGDYKGGKAGRSQPLNSPWDVLIDPSAPAAAEPTLLVAMAGSHQIWRVDTSSGRGVNFSGTGYERNQNGATALTTAWAQPSGLSAGAKEGEVYVADSESSCIRALNLSTGGSRILAGGDPLFSDNLFRFGLRDGFGSDALLQHPLGVATLPSQPGYLFVSDSYNHCIRRIDLETQEIVTIAGTGKPGFKDGRGATAQFSEPQGITRGPKPDTLLIADTNNCVLRLLDTKTLQVATLDLSDIPAPRVDPSLSLSDDIAAPPVPAGATYILGTEEISAADGVARLDISLPAGYHFTPGTTPTFEARAIGGADPSWLNIKTPKGTLIEGKPLEVSFERGPGGADAVRGSQLLLRVTAKVYFCKDKDVCLQELVVFDMPFSEKPALGGRGDVKLGVSITV